MSRYDALDNETQYKVLWLSNHLYENGIDGIHFSKKMREDLRATGEEDIEKGVKQRLAGLRV